MERRTLLLWSNSTCVNGNAFPGFGGRDRLLDLLRCHCGSASQARQRHLGRALMRALDPVAWPRWRQSAVPFGKRNPSALAATNPAP